MQPFESYIIYTIVVDKKEVQRRFDFIGKSLTFSTGDSLEVKQGYSHDGTNQSQSITRRVRNTALGGSLRWVCSHEDCMSEGVFIMDYIAQAEELCGKEAVLTFNGVEYPKFIVRTVGVSANVDAVNIYSDVSLSLEVTEGRVRKQEQFTATGANKKGKDILAEQGGVR